MSGSVSEHSGAGLRRSSTPLGVVQPGEVEYRTAWERQRELAAARVRGTGADTLLLLTHPAVYTAGSRTRPEDRPEDGTEVVDVDRGGRITWHGPGQLVGYPIVALVEPVDVVAFVRRVEQALIQVCTDLGLPGTGRIPGRSGVWMAATPDRPERKIAAIGVRVARGVTMHGFALNCDADLAAFAKIVPCGLTDAGVTSLTVETGRRIGTADATPATIRRIGEALDGELPLTDRDLDRTHHPGTTPRFDPVLAG